LALQKALGYTFREPKWLERALTHRSFSADHNERLEFLGDAVLGLAVSTALVSRWRNLPEGDLSRVRANLVKQPTLAELAQNLGLEGHLRLGSGEMQSGGRHRPSILADALEALLGAVYSDGGFEAATAVVEKLYTPWLTQDKLDAMGKDAKTALQEWLQGHKMALPIYQVLGTVGLAHEQTFQVSCRVDELDLESRGEGTSRREAEQQAANAMLQSLPKAPKRIQPKQ
jgi:ribonuclease-3